MNRPESMPAPLCSIFDLHRLQVRSPNQLLLNAARHFKHWRVFVTWTRSGLGFETFMTLSGANCVSRAEGRQKTLPRRGRVLRIAKEADNHAR